MERIHGRKVTEHGLRSAHERSQLASVLTTSLLTHPILSTRDDAVFHGDPHAGNLLLTHDGRLALLDWSLAGRLTQKDREALVHLLIGATMLDELRVVEMLAVIAQDGAPDDAALLSVVRRRFRQIQTAWPPDIGWFVGLIDDAVERAGLRTGADLLLFRKSLHMVDCMVAEIGLGERLIDQAAVFDFLHHLAMEWPQRWFAAGDSRAFSTRLSNADLAQLLLNYPAAVTRFWLGSVSQRAPNALPHSA